MAAATTTEKGLAPATLEVSPDRLQAWIKLSEPDERRPLTRGDVVEALKAASILVDDRTTARVDEFLSWIETAADRSERFLIAEGRAPIEGPDGQFTLHESLARREAGSQEADRIDYHAFNSIVTVQAGEPIGRCTPPTEVRPGVDVFGKPIEPRRRGEPWRLGSGVKISDEDPTLLVSSCAGRVLFRDRTISIQPVVDVPGDVDFECGNVDAEVDVVIKGTILDDFKVRTKGCIRVGGAVQAAEVEAGGDIVVKGGILGKMRGGVSAGGQIAAKFSDEARITAGGDIRFAKELMNCRVHCEGAAKVTHGAVIGGELYAKEGAEIGTLGSEANVSTSVIVGIHPDILDKAESITEQSKAKMKTIEKIRASVQPLMANLKRLTPEQKERATELLFSADSMAADIAEAEEGRERMLQEGRAKNLPSVLVSKVIHPGSRVRIGRRHVVFQDVMKGPVKIEKRKVQNITEFVAVHQLSGSIAVLKSAYIVGGPTPKAAADGAGEV